MKIHKLILRFQKEEISFLTLMELLRAEEEKVKTILIGQIKTQINKNIPENEFREEEIKCYLEEQKKQSIGRKKNFQVITSKKNYSDISTCPNDMGGKIYSIVRMSDGMEFTIGNNTNKGKIISISYGEIYQIIIETEKHGVVLKHDNINELFNFHN